MNRMSEDPSVKKMWRSYLQTLEDSAAQTQKTCPAWHFDLTEKGANELVDLVLRGMKRATTSALWVYEHEHEPIPAAGDYSVITDWEGIAKCIIQTTGITIVPFNEVTAEMAAKEGEGDLSLSYWQKGHALFFRAECRAIGAEFIETIPVVFEEFEVVYIP